jgi:hypothetical protein
MLPSSRGCSWRASGFHSLTLLGISQESWGSLRARLYPTPKDIYLPHILWKNVLRTRMSIEQFLNIYCPLMSKDGLVEILVHQDPMFIHLNQGKYSNNKYWKEQIFRVSGDWECPHGVALPKDQMVPREWRPLVDDFRILPSLSVVQKEEVKDMLLYSQDPINWIDEDMAGIDFDHTVTNDALREHLEYHISERQDSPWQK